MVLKNLQFFFFFYYLGPIIVFFYISRKQSKGIQQWTFLQKKFIQGVFPWFFRNCKYQSAEFVLCCIHCIKILLLSHKNQLLDIFSNFYHQRRTWQWRHGAPGIKPRPATQLAAPAFGAVFINPEWNQDLKISKCSINIYQKTI